jgi:hypothetical protein
VREQDTQVDAWARHIAAAMQRAGIGPLHQVPRQAARRPSNTNRSRAEQLLHVFCKLPLASSRDAASEPERNQHSRTNRFRELRP